MATTNNPDAGIYDLTGKTLYVFSDLEGSNPFKFGLPDQLDPKDKILLEKDFKTEISIDKIESSKEGTYNLANIVGSSWNDGNMDLKKSKKNMVIKEFSQGGLEIIDGIITQITNPATAIAYTGDLFDNRPYSIHLMLHMLNLKRASPNSVIIIGGNRDFNKLRLGIELFLLDNNNQPIFSKPWTSLKDLMAAKLHFRIDTPPEYLNFDNWTFGRDKAKVFNLLNFTDQSNFKQRFIDIMTISMGAQPDSYIEEIKTLFPTYKNGGDQLYKLACILFMLMSFPWPSENVPEELKPYNGKLYEYFKKMHVLAMFNMTQNGLLKKGILSHGGYKDFTVPFGYDLSEVIKIDKTKNISLNNLLIELSKDKDQMLCIYKNLICSQNVDLSVVRYIGSLFFQASPLGLYGPISWIPGPKVGDQPFFSGKWEGKGGTDFYSTNMNTNSYCKENQCYTLDKSSSDDIDYNIYGHRPQLFFPSIVQTGNTKNICLDICRADFGGGGVNNYSFAVLKLAPIMKESKIFGRTRLGSLTTPEKGVAVIQNRIIYYDIQLDNYKIVPETVNLDQFDLTGIIKSVGFNRIYEPSTSGTAGGRKSRRRGRKHRYTKKYHRHKKHHTKCKKLYRKCRKRNSKHKKRNTRCKR